MKKIRPVIFIIQFPLLLVVLFACSLEGVKGQSYSIKHFTDRDNLAGMTIYRILQDKTGFLWLATEHGLCRYDGQNFKRIDSPQLKGYEIISLSIDSKNRIWFSSFIGQICYLEGDKVIPFLSEELPANPTILEVYIDSDDQIWICTPAFMLVFREKEAPGTFELVSKIPLEPNRSLYNVREDANKVVWSTRHGKTRPEAALYQPSHPEAPPVNIEKAGSLLIYHSPSGRTFLFQTNPVPLILEIKENRAIPVLSEYYAEMTGGIHSILEDKKRHLWISTKRGVFHFDENYNPLNEAQLILDGIQVNVVFQDREGNYWFGTNSEGLSFMSSMTVTNYDHLNSGLADDQVYSITNDEEGNIWFGLSNGLLSSFSGKEIKSYSIEKQLRITALHYSGSSNSLIVGSDRSLFELKNNRFYDFDTHEAIKAIAEGTDNSIWVANSTNLNQYYPATGEKIIRLSTRCYDVFKDLTGKIWVASKNGIWIVEDDVLLPVKIAGQEQLSMRISDIEQTSDSIIWLATYGQGIFSYKNGNFRQFTTEHGLASNICKALTKGKDGILWIGTDRGLNKMDYTKQEFLEICQLDGLISDEINVLHAFDDKIWVGTPKGVSVFNEDAKFLDTLPPEIYITSLAIADKDTMLLPQYVIPFRKNDIKIGYNGVSFKSGSGLFYQYRMKGLDSTWIETKDKLLNFRRLDPGAYRFEVRSLNADRIHSAETASVDFMVLAPVTQRLWFKIIGIIFLAGIILLAGYFTVFFTRRSQRREQAIKEKINQLRMQALQAQMNPHFIFNALNAILHLLSVNDRKSAIKYLAMFARLIRLIFEHSKKNKIPLDSELEFLKLYLELEKLRFEEKVIIDFEVDEKINPQNIRIPPLLIQPIIENAFKHGLLHKESGGMIRIAFEQEDNYLKCTIEDNGVGREKAEELGSWRPKGYLSSGLKTTEERLSLLNKSDDPDQQQVNMKVHDLVDPYGKSAGTKVELSIEVA